MRPESIMLLRCIARRGGDVARMVFRIADLEGIDLGVSRRASRYIPTDVRADVLARDGLFCRLCLGPVDPDDVHLDHVMPWSLGGETSRENLQVAHSFCNISKGARVH